MRRARGLSPPRPRSRRAPPAPPPGWAEETLRAIRAGEVDAFVMTGSGGRRTFELTNEVRPFRVLIERMNEGALTLSANGTILYCNRRLAELLRRPHARVLGASLRDFLRSADHPRLEALLAQAQRSRVVAEITLQRQKGGGIPVQLSLGPVGSGRALGPRTRVVGVVTDVSERHRAARARSHQQQRLLVAVDEERRHLARELHDETGQSLTALLIGLRSLSDAPTLQRARSSAGQLRELTARTLEDVGRLARGLHPSILDELGLGAAATRYVNEFERTHGIRATLRTSGLESHRLPRALATAVYRLLQEGLTNVARHANARKVEIALRREAARVTVEVHDDGRGFNVRAALREPAGGRGGHLGLVSMRERAELFGGSLEVRSVVGRGTTVVARLPVSDAWDSAPRRRNGRGA